MDDCDKTGEQLLDELGVLRQRVSELEVSEKALRASDAMHVAMMDAMDDGIHVNDREGRYIAVNAAMAARQDMPKEEVLGKTPYDLYDHDIAVMAMEHYRRVISTGEALDTETEFPNQTPRHRHIHRTPMRNGSGEIVGVVTVSRNISHRKSIEETLRQERDFTSAVIDTIGNLLVVLDRQAHIVRVNPAFERITGYSSEEIKGKAFSRVFPSPADDEQGRAAFEATLSGQFPNSSENVLATRSGGRRMIAWTNTALLDSSGKVEYVIAVGSDVTEHRLAEAAVRENNARLVKWVDELERRNQESVLLNKMGDLLQTCLTFDEAYSVVAHMAPKLFPFTAGGLFVISASRNLADAVATWGDFPTGERVFTPDQCWALRRGQAHVVEHSASGLVCRHIDRPLPSSYLCVPMMAQGEILGSLHLRIDDESAGLISARQQLAVTVAEHIALALANLKLQQSLRDQAIHDLLTGLFNRRYMEEMLERELLRANRRGNPVGIIMIDIDHFKQFNDLFGHEAGDALLSALGNSLRASVRGEDIACRYGGEEFLLILPDSSLEDTRARAEMIREGIASLRVDYRRQPLGPITASLGVAGFPEHGTNRGDIVQASDRALYRAKADGRDRVAVAWR